MIHVEGPFGVPWVSRERERGREGGEERGREGERERGREGERDGGNERARECVIVGVRGRAGEGDGE